MVRFRTHLLRYGMKPNKPQQENLREWFGSKMWEKTATDWYIVLLRKMCSQREIRETLFSHYGTCSKFKHS